MSIRKDYIERLIEQFAAALAKVLKARQERRTEDALDLIREAGRSLLGMEYGVLTMVDAASTARLLDAPERVKVLAKLVHQEAEVRRERGEGREADERFLLALELHLEARERGVRLEGGDAREFEELRARVGEVALSERYQRLLARA
ncbi:hypothetical protein P2318_00520 [Myxococcaceae bacterium GXIMD 01537]